MSENSGETAKGGNLWLPESGALAFKGHKRPRKTRIALVILLAFGAFALPLLYVFDYGALLQTTALDKVRFLEDLRAGGGEFTWQLGGLPLLVKSFLWVLLVAVCWTGFPTARKLMVGDRNKFFKNLWKWILGAQVVLIVILVVRIFSPDAAPYEALRDEGYSVAHLSSGENREEVFVVGDKEGNIYRLVQNREEGSTSYKLTVPQELSKNFSGKE